MIKNILLILFLMCIASHGEYSYTINGHVTTVDDATYTETSISQKNETGWSYAVQLSGDQQSETWWDIGTTEGMQKFLDRINEGKIKCPVRREGK